MWTLLLAASLSGAPTCSGPDLLRGVGRFESWGYDGIDDIPVGWEVLASGNGVKRSVHAMEGYAAGFQTVYGPGSTVTHAMIRNTELLLSAHLGGQQPRTVSVRIEDMETGRFLNTAGAWQDGEADALVQQAVSAFPNDVLQLPFTAEGTPRMLRVEIRSAAFGQCGSDGLCDCSPGLCPTGWADDVRLCAR